MPPNVFDPQWDRETERPPYRWRRAHVGQQAGSQELGASLFEVPPGGSTFPLHAHHANEELLVVLAGRPTLRGLNGERELAPGDVAAFPRGREGAHRIDNRGDEPARVLMVSTMHGPDINEFPDSGILWARGHAPGPAAPDRPVVVVGREGDALDPLSLP